MRRVCLHARYCSARNKPGACPREAYRLVREGEGWRKAIQMRSSGGLGSDAACVVTAWRAGSGVQPGSGRAEEASSKPAGSGRPAMLVVQKDQLKPNTTRKCADKKSNFSPPLTNFSEKTMALSFSQKMAEKCHVYVHSHIQRFVKSTNGSEADTASAAVVSVVFP